MTTAPGLPPGTLVADKFRIERLLGAGAMGSVYAVQHELTRHRRALKLLHADVRIVPELVRRFLNEASAAGRAGSPHLVETFDAGTLPSGEPYVVMELLEGETASALLERESVLEPEVAAELVAQAAEGIAAAHAAGIIHRDLKPENLFVTRREAVPFVKILDFGVSKFATASTAGATRTRAGMLYGSPAYMSPEQLTGAEDIDARADVFSLGVVLYQFLTGKLPFEGTTLEALAIRVLAGNVTPVESLRPALAPALVAVVQRALAPERDERFPSARALAEALTQFRPRASTDQALALGLARTAHSELPVSVTADIDIPLSKVPYLRVIGVAAALAAIATIVVLESRQPEPATVARSASPPSASPAEPATTLAPGRPRAPQASLATAAPAKPWPEPVATGAHLRTPKPQATPPLASVPAPATAASARSSSAQALGLQEENPFR